MSLADNVRNHRRRAGFTQEELAHEAGVSLGVVKKVEGDYGNARVESLHAMARAMGTTTSALFASEVPAPVRDDGNAGRLVELRRALMPPVGLTEHPTDVDRDADVDVVRRDVDDAHALYHADRYDSVATRLPAVLKAAESTVTLADDDAARQRALAVRAHAFLLAGKYLTQVRQYDAAYYALSRAIEGARATGQTLAAAAGVVGMAWLLLRQDRFEECEAMAAQSAERVEPRFSAATPGQVAVWGELCLRVAAAASRNNRPDVADEARRMAVISAGALDSEHVNFREHWSSFGPVTVETKVIEALALLGDARGVLRRADDGPVSGNALRRCGKPSQNNWDRHRLDIARAHVTLGSHQDAMDVLAEVLHTSPQWLRHQSMARHIMTDLLATRKRTLTKQMREMAAHLEVQG
ncbi:helix-turn-helix domain-containing protein [Streptomyces iconiensis]|uniref:Helix-turn-helix domain-containing protein n=1 Tax=Streptomyces iconiensis TaxID=1384038 RepID=A0ABT7AAA3_9ACTN|nr:helix-turn-helix domain-containing protein [Streptomyces iconiensis]MDJ1138275.1 helix-turn-helix domain-containing protein [Streptomyces iconiensis]